MSKYIALPVLALLFVTNPVFAVNAGSCDAQAARMKEAERSKFMVSCLSRQSSSSNVKQVVQQKKKSTCEQNARNQALQGSKRDSYLRSCMQENEAAVAIGDIKGTSAIGVQKPVAAAPEKPAEKPRATCEEQARKDGLKGSERKNRIKKCKGVK